MRSRTDSDHWLFTSRGSRYSRQDKFPWNWNCEENRGIVEIARYSLPFVRFQTIFLIDNYNYSNDEFMLYIYDTVITRVITMIKLCSERRAEID